MTMMDVLSIVYSFVIFLLQLPKKKSRKHLRYLVR